MARACLEFRRRFQGISEAAAEFVAALRELAPDCEFPDGTLPCELALQILTGCRSQKARERMLLRPIDLDDYVQILETDEAVKDDVAAFAAATGQSASSSVRPVQSKSCKQSVKRQGQVHTPLGGAPSLECLCCGKGGHRAKDQNCPTKNDMCRFCHKLGHWDSRCFTKQKARQSDSANTGYKVKQGAKQIRRIEPSIQAVSMSLPLPVPEPYKHTVQICDSMGQQFLLTTDVDTGSYCSVVERKWFDSHLPAMPLHWLSTPSYAFGGVPIHGFDGYFCTTAVDGPRECECKLVVASSDITPIIGRDLINALNLTVHGSNKVAQVGSCLTVALSAPLNSVQTPSKQSPDCCTDLLREFPALTLDTLGVVPDFQHRITLQPDAVPIACQPRPIPLALREGVEKAVWELDRNRIWEPIEKSEWALHLVTPVKPMGEVCITTDFTPLNKFVMPS